jgi:hypothetical protein
LIQPGYLFCRHCRNSPAWNAAAIAFLENPGQLMEAEPGS